MGSIPSRVSLLLVMVLLAAPFSLWAENIDPARDGSKFAWGENVGWINFRPMFGPGVTVTGSALSGYAWGENIGWINLGPPSGGVLIDEYGILSGHAWGENVGWINFAPGGGNVYIDACGDFNGEAWGENIGWIRFRSSGPVSHKVTTSWLPIDITLPVSTMDAPVLDWYNSNPTFTISSTDCGSGIAHLWYVVDDVPVDTAGSSASATITGDGIHTFSFYSVDSAGNRESSTEVSVRIDTTPPDIVLTTPAESAVLLINRNVPADFNVTDALSGVANVSSTIPYGSSVYTSAVGTYTFTVSANDVAGNSSSMTHTYAVSFPGNIEPDTHFAWGENIGWINFRPPRGPGVTVTDTALTGYAWSENVGWIHFNPPQGGVVNERGILSGSAWGENVGWIKFDHIRGGVTIDPATGVFLGYAWGENIGWIKFSSSGDVPLGVKTSWRPMNDVPVVTISPQVQSLDEGGTYTASGSFSDLDQNSWNATVDYGDGTGTQALPLVGKNFNLGHVYKENGSYTVTVSVSDGVGGAGNKTASVTVNNAPPGVGQVTGPAAPVPVGTNTQMQAHFSDQGTLDTHTATATWEDGTTEACTVSGSNGSGTATCIHSYSIPGVYTVTVTVTDNDGGEGKASYEYIVAYDPSGGFVTGGGWISSPAGAYIPTPALFGKATFGFVSKFQKGAAVPTGNTEFQFHVANFKFESSGYEWLVVASARAQYKGTGMVNGSGNYGFLLTVVDGQVSGGGGTDKFRIKIWDKSTDAVIYDNQMDESDNAAPATPISGGSIVIHK